MTLQVNLTKDAVTEALEKIVAGHEDYIYPIALDQGRCRYSNPDGTPSCIVGHVIDALAPEALAIITEHENTQGESCGVGDLGYLGQDPDEGWGEPLLELTFDGALHALQMAQTAQDGILTWGEALEYYRRILAGELTSSDAYDEIHNETAKRRRARAKENNS